MVKDEDAPPPPKMPKKKRTLTKEQLQKMADGKKRKAEERKKQAEAKERDEKLMLLRKEELIKKKIEEAEEYQKQRLKINKQNMELRLKAKQRMENSTTADVEAEIDEKLSDILDTAVDGEISDEMLSELLGDVPEMEDHVEEEITEISPVAAEQDKPNVEMKIEPAKEDVGIEELFEKKRDEIADMMPSKHSKQIFLKSCSHYDFKKDVKYNINMMIQAAQEQIKSNKQAIGRRKQEMLEKRRKDAEVAKQKQQLLKDEKVRRRMVNLMKLY